MTGTNLNFTDGEMLPVRLCAECPVMSPFKLLCQSCGLSLREARRFLNVRDRIVRHWWNGTLKPPKDVIAQLWHLFQRIDRRAQATVNHTLEQIEVHGRPDFIQLAIAGMMPLLKASTGPAPARTGLSCGGSWNCCRRS
jgi:hypothetical protein